MSSPMDTVTESHMAIAMAVSAHCTVSLLHAVHPTRLSVSLSIVWGVRLVKVTLVPFCSKVRFSVWVWFYTSNCSFIVFGSE